MTAIRKTETFFQQYVDGDSTITVYWGLSAGEMVFLVFDRTNGLADDVSFRIQAGDAGNIGILTTTEGERVLSDGDVVEIFDDGVDIEPVHLDATQLLTYLDTPGFPFGIVGVRNFSST